MAKETPMSLVEFKAWYSSRVLWSGEAATQREALEIAVKNGADLTGAILPGTDLVGITVPHLDAQILAMLDAGGGLDMDNWHTCATTHCRAGWAITLAGEAGAALEACLGPSTAGALIYHASAGYVPNFTPLTRRRTPISGRMRRPIRCPMAKPSPQGDAR